MTSEQTRPDIALIGLNHKTADVALRECFTYNGDERESLYESLKASGVEEAVYLTTCNRMEIYCVAHDVESSIGTVREILIEREDVDEEMFDSSFYVKMREEAVEHLLTVVCSLDSMVVGENEIVSQVKEAYTYAVENRWTGTILNKLFHAAFRTSKQVRTETDICRNPLSMAYIAVELVHKIFPDLSTHSALLIGAGEMGHLILKYLTKFNIGRIVIANRSQQNAEAIAEEINAKAEIIRLEEIEDAVDTVDILIASAGAPHYIVSPEIMPRIVHERKDRPLFMIDIAVPRDIDPALSGIEGLHLYNIDDLKSIADENLKNRMSEMELAREYIKANVKSFFEIYDDYDLAPTIASLQNKFNEIRSTEIEKSRRKKLKHLSDEDFALVEELTIQIMTKTLHNPIMNLKRHHRQKDEEPMGERLRRKTKFVEELFVK